MGIGISPQTSRISSVVRILYVAIVGLAFQCLMVGCGTTNYAGVATSKSPEIEKVNPPPVHSLETLVLEPTSLEEPHSPSTSQEDLVEGRTPPPLRTSPGV